MTTARQQLEIREFPLPAPSAEEAVIRIRCCTICRSDLHTWSGRRPGPTPAILGHEIVGEIATLGPGLTRDAAGQPLAEGDRVTWTRHSSCGRCVYCTNYNLPMKCQHVRKYGHQDCTGPPHLNGGFAEYCVVDAGTSLLKVPPNIPDLVAAPLNCAVATVVAGWEAAALQPTESVLIQGAGGLGCYAAAYASFVGANRVIVTDIKADRLDIARRFGATDCINVAQQSDQQVIDNVRRLTDGLGADCVLEVAGVPEAVSLGLAALRKGGRFIEQGCSFPEATTSIDLSVVLWNLLTIRGVHNYDVRHLRRALEFVCETVDRFPYQQLVSSTFPLAEINEAFSRAQENSLGRVAIDCQN